MKMSMLLILLIICLCSETFANEEKQIKNDAGLITFNADVALLASSTIVIEIGGYNRGTEYDAYNINGNLMIDTGVTLDIDWLNLFEPNSGDIFDLAFITGDINGSFDFLPTDWQVSIVDLMGNQGRYNHAIRLTYLNK